MRHFQIVICCIILAAPSLFAQSSLILARPEGSIPTDIAARVLVEAYSRLGIALSLREFPAERALQTSNLGETDGEVARVKGIESQYTNLLMVNVPVIRFDIVAFTKGLSFPVDGWQSLKPYSIIIQLGIKFYEQNTAGMNVIAVASNEKAFELLELGRVEVIAVSRLTGLTIIHGKGYREINYLEPPLATVNLYHFLHKKHAALIPGIEAVLLEMEKSGEIAAVKAQAVREITGMDE